MAHTGTANHTNHSTHREAAGMGCTKSVCSCGVASAPTNRPQHLGRWERSHLTWHAKQAARQAA